MVEPKILGPRYRVSGARKNDTGVKEVSFVVCRHCGVRVKNMDAHMKKVHSLRAQSEGGTDAGPAVTFSLTKCPVCHQLVKHLSRHFATTGHGDVKVKSHVLPLDLAVQRDGSGWHCPYCPVTLPSSVQLSSHLVGSHGVRKLNPIT
jgi:hypothetical protein